VEADGPRLARLFGALCDLQPVARHPDGVACAPRVAPDRAAVALARLPLPVRPLAAAPGRPDPPSALVAGFYRRSPTHLPAPGGWPELVQAPGPAFGPGDHPTTAGALRALRALPPGPALDAGCGSGLLGLAWARLARGPVLAVDADPAACRQAHASARASGLAAWVRVERRPLESLPVEALHGRTLLANLPRASHEALLARLPAPPPAAVLSGLRANELPPLLAAYRRRGLRVVALARAGGHLGATLVASP
jgi:ribosomal protein L11 methyltransferase